MTRIVFWYDGCGYLNVYLVRNATILPFTALGLLDDAVQATWAQKSWKPFKSSLFPVQLVV